MATRKSATRKGRTSRKPQTVKLANVITTYAERRGIETSKAGKAIRSRLRSHFDDYQERFNYPGDGKENRDGNRWPADMPRELAKELLS
jgi:hypothetical protein